MASQPAASRCIPCLYVLSLSERRHEGMRLRADNSRSCRIDSPERFCRVNYLCAAGCPVSVHRNVSWSVSSWIFCSTLTPAEWPPARL